MCQLNSFTLKTRVDASKVPNGKSLWSVLIFKLLEHGEIQFGQNHVPIPCQGAWQQFNTVCGLICLPAQPQPWTVICKNVYWVEYHSYQVKYFSESLGSTKWNLFHQDCSLALFSSRPTPWWPSNIFKRKYHAYRIKDFRENLKYNTCLTIFLRIGRIKFTSGNWKLKF